MYCWLPSWNTWTHAHLNHATSRGCYAQGAGFDHLHVFDNEHRLSRRLCRRLIWSLPNWRGPASECALWVNEWLRRETSTSGLELETFCKQAAFLPTRSPDMGCINPFGSHQAQQYIAEVTTHSRIELFIFSQTKRQVKALFVRRRGGRKVAIAQGTWIRPPTLCWHAEGRSSLFSTYALPLAEESGYCLNRDD